MHDGLILRSEGIRPIPYQRGEGASSGGRMSAFEREAGMYFGLKENNMSKSTKPVDNSTLDKIMDLEL